MMKKLTEAQCWYAMQHGEFAPEVLMSAERVVIILTQSWCPQWERMQAYIDDALAEIAFESDKNRSAGNAPLSDSDESKQQHVFHANSAPGAAVFYLEYDKESWFEEFMDFKETVFNNREIPYVRYYKAGNLVAASNYVSREGFISRLR